MESLVEIIKNKKPHFQHMGFDSLPVDIESAMNDFFCSNTIIKIFKKNGEKETTRSIEKSIKEFNSGSTIYFIDSKKIRDFVTENHMLVDFETLSKVRFSAFFSKKNSSMPLHWDKLHNCTIQLLGRKEWLYKPNSYFKNPNFNWAVNLDKAPDVDGFGQLTDEEHYESKVLYPGSMLYLPRGFLHKTETIEDSFSISINIEPYTLIEHLKDRVNKDNAYYLLRKCMLEDESLSSFEKLEIDKSLDKLLTSLIGNKNE